MDLRLMDLRLHRRRHAAESGSETPRPGFDKSTAIGLFLGAAMLALAIGFGGSLGSFIDLPSLLIVAGGTLSAVVVCCSLSDVVDSVRTTARMVRSAPPDAPATALALLKIAAFARQHGILALQNLEDSLVREPFLHKALTLAIDGSDAADIEGVMQQDLEATLEARRRSALVLRKAAEFAPAMGLIGTLVGLVQMLGSMGDPHSIGPGMALALLTTFYGAVLAHLILGPLAARLDRNAGDEALVHRMCLIAAVSVSLRENPRRLQVTLNSVLPPAGRLSIYE